MIRLEGLPALPRDRHGPVFREPWEAKAFGLTAALQERGIFTAAEWAQALGREIAAAGADDGTRYYELWLVALERLVREKGLV